MFGSFGLWNQWTCGAQHHNQLQVLCQGSSWNSNCKVAFPFSFTQGDGGIGGSLPSIVNGKLWWIFQIAHQGQYYYPKTIGPSKVCVS
jgi:hypothetical protein